jgi:hypothetical protein
MQTRNRMFRSDGLARHDPSQIRPFLPGAQADILQRAPREYEHDPIGPSTGANPPDERQAIYIPGLLANSGVQTESIHDELRALTRSEVDLVRYQAYAAIANIGTDDTVADLLTP